MGKIRSIVARANKQLSIRSAAILLASATLISSLLGLFRDRLLNSMYYTTYPAGLDAYIVAFTIPDFMYYILVSGALSVTFIPVFTQRVASGNKKSAWELSSSIINFMAIITLIASVLIIIFADPLVRYVIGPGLDESSRALAVSMMRVIAINPFLFAIATVLSSMQQAVNRFTFYALAPAIYNVGIIIGALFFTNGITLFGHRIFDGGIMGVALGVALGSILQLIVITIGLINMGFEYRFKIYWKNKAFHTVLKLLPARSISQSIDYINSIIETSLSSQMIVGTVRAFQQTMSLHLVPINLIGVAISTAAFPDMSRRLGEGKVDLFKKDLSLVVRSIIWLALPVVLITYFARGYIIAFIKNGGDSLMSEILAILVLDIFFQSIYYIAARSFYAQQDTKTPLFISASMIALNIILAFWFTYGLKAGASGLAWAEVISSIGEVLIMFIVLSKRLHGLFNHKFIEAMIKMTSAAGFTALTAYLMVKLLPMSKADNSFFIVFPKFLAITIASFLVYGFVSYLFGLEEVKPFVAKLKSMLFFWRKSNEPTTNS